MAAIAYDNNLVPGSTREWQLDDTLTYKQGQCVRFVGASNDIAPATTELHGAAFVGVAQFTAPMESEPLGPNAAFPVTGAVMERGTFRFKGKDGETYAPRDAVEIDPAQADGQSVRLNSAGSNDPTLIIGYISTKTPKAGVLIDVTGESRFVDVDIVPLGLGADVTVHE